MEHKRLGNCDLKVSRLCLGCITWGAPDKGTHPCLNAALACPGSNR